VGKWEVGEKLTESSLGVVYPVRRKEPTEGCDKDDAAVVGDGFRQRGDLARRAGETEVVHEELYAGASDGDAALKSIHGFPAVAEVVGHGGQEAGLGDDRLGADIVQEEAPRAVRVLGLPRAEATLADQGARLIAQAPSDGHVDQGAAGHFPESLGI
jgi:hypothetical protein